MMILCEFRGRFKQWNIPLVTKFNNNNNKKKNLLNIIIFYLCSSGALRGVSRNHVYIIVVEQRRIIKIRVLLVICHRQHERDAVTVKFQYL